jgi:hypothetical protein
LLNSLVGLSPLCQASALDQALVPKEFLPTKPPSEQAPASKPPSKSGGGGPRRKDAVPASEGWKSVDEMKADVRRYGDHDFNKTDKDLIEKKINATADVAIKNSEKRDDAICMLWECGVSLDNINFSEETKEKINPLITLTDTERSKLAEIIYGKNDEDFIKLALFIAILHDNTREERRKFRSFMFKSVVNEILDLSKYSHDDEIKSIIENELERSGYGDSLASILSD